MCGLEGTPFAHDRTIRVLVAIIFGANAYNMVSFSSDERSSGKDYVMYLAGAFQTVQALATGVDIC